MKKIVIIGGGASGLVSAIVAKRILEDKAEVIILEKKDKIGKKILATGNGRCNITNINATTKNYYGKNIDFINHVLQNFNPKDTISFFEELGIYHKIESEGKVYPFSDQASSVLDVLRNEIEHLGIVVNVEFDVNDILPTKKGFKIIDINGKTILSDKVIVSTGGMASKNLGSDGSGFNILKKLGHTMQKTYPALVQIKTETSLVKSLQGVKFDGNISLKHKYDMIDCQYGEILFTDYGISGPPVIQMSRLVSLYDDLIVCLDFMPNHNLLDVVDILEKRKEYLKYLTMENFLVGFLNKKVGQVLTKYSGIEKLSMCINDLTINQIKNIAYIIKNLEIKVIGTKDFQNAQATGGGISTSEFDNKTMQSNLIKNLYATGEVLDVLGDCGGYNLQWAWSSGYLAGQSLAKSILEEK